MIRIHEKPSATPDSTSVLAFEKGSGDNWTTYKITVADLKSQLITVINNNENNSNEE